MKPASPTHERIIQSGGADGKSTARLFQPAVAGILIVAAGLKAGLLFAKAFPFNADEAIVGLMARHILQGRWPTFFYGQAYMGSLDAALVAGAFSLLGSRVDAIRLVQLILYLGTVLTTVLVASRVYGPKPALIAGLLLAIPSVNLTLYTTISLGGYGEALLIGNLLLIAALAIAEDRQRRWAHLFWGFLSGLGLWAFGLTLVYVLPTAILVLWSIRSARPSRKWSGAGPKIGLIGLGFLAGASPWIVYAVRNGVGPLLTELGGTAIAGASPTSLAASVASHTFNLLIFGTTVIFGLRPPWGVDWLAPLLAPVTAAFWLGSIVYAVHTIRRPSSVRLPAIVLVGVAVCLLGGFILTPFGADPSGRYFAPLAIPMAVFGAGMVDSVARRAGILASAALLACVLAFNFWGTIDSARRMPPGLTTQFNPTTRIDHAYDPMLIEFLSSHGEMRGYTNYWVAYPLAFLTAESVLYVPRLPYHADLGYTPRDDRYAPYDDVVSQSPRVAYITTGPRSVESTLEGYFARLGVSYQVADIGDYHVYYALSRRVPPPDFTDMSEE